MVTTTPPAIAASSPLTPARATGRHSRRRRWIKRGLVIAGGLAIVGGLVYAWLPKPIAVDVAAVGHNGLEVVVDGDGKTRVRARYVVASPIGGTLERIQLTAGDAIGEGEPVAYVMPPDPAMLDDRTRAAARARVAAATAVLHQTATQIGRARAARDLAVREAARVRALARTGAVTGSELERVELGELTSRADVEQAELAARAAEADLASARAAIGIGIAPSRERIAVRAPAGGKVLRVVRDSAGPIAPGAPLLELGDPCELEAVIDVLSSEAARIPPNAEVAIEGWGGSPLIGRVERIEPSAFTRVSALGIEEQRVNVIVALTTPPPRLGDGYRVEARIVIWRGDHVVTVPTSALFRSGDGWAVYVVDDGVARLRRITIGHRGRLAVEVVDGLTTGAIVIVHPADRIRDGVRVVAETAPAT